MTLEITADGGHQVNIDTPILIREAARSDVGPMSEMWGPERAGTQRRLLQRYFDEQRQAVQAGHVAEFNGALVGQVWTRFRNIDPRISNGLAAAYMHTLTVVEPFRRLGVAEALTRAASSAASARGHEHIAIGVDRPNEYARRLYEKWGFRAYYETNDLRGELIFLRRHTFE